MNCLYTLNYDNYMCQNARESFQAAAHRWHCAYFELQDDFELYGEYNKVLGIKKHLMSCEKVLYMDADMLIRVDTPNPFELFTSDKVYVVKDTVEGWDQERLSFFKEEVSDAWIHWGHAVLGHSGDGKAFANSCHEWFFNAGWFLCQPRAIEKEIDLFIKTIPGGLTTKRQGRPEQGLWNCMLKSADKIEYVGREWNFIDPECSNGKMDCYIYHFTGLSHEHLKQIIPTYDWKTVPRS